jgi:phosphorylcholine metabolism protein LicD/GR25 family glycosyltransferase involved in LPS biosynthesis
MSLKLADPKIISLLYQMMYDVHQILTINNIPYWVDGGTFLGAIRHKGIIPWDDDLDIGMMYTDKPRLLELQGVLAKCGYTLIKYWFGFKIFYTHIKPTEFNYSFPNLDIFLYDKKDNSIYLHYKRAREIWPKERWEPSELFPLQLYKFGDISVYGPQTYQNYFDEMYGKDWNEIAYRQYDHEKEEEVERVKVNLTRSMRKPAQPTEVKERSCVKCIVNEVSDKSIIRWKEPETYECTTDNCTDNFDMKIATFLINCEFSKDRLEKFNRYADKAGVHACRVPCVMGRRFTYSEICKMKSEGMIANKDLDMNQVHIAINMSHYNCWQKLVNSCLDYALIMEDDTEVRSHFIDSVNLIMKAVTEKLGDEQFSILHLWNGNWAKTISRHKPFLKINDKFNVVQETKGYNAEAVAYIISKRYAKYLMNHFFPIKKPQDELMGDFPKVGKHLTLKMKFSKSKDCYISPLITMPCGGEGGTGKTTQTNDPSVGTYDCAVCK